MRIIILIAIAALVSCAGNGGDEHVIQFWQFWSDINTRPVIEQLVRQFEQENPGVKVKITDLTWANGHEKLVISFAAHQPPDIMELGSDWIPEFASNGLLAEVTGDFPSNYLFPARWDNKTFAVPWLLDTRILYLNLDLLDRVGAGIPHTWPELLDACRRIDSLGEDVFGFGANSAERHRLYKKFLPFLWSNGGQVISPDGARSELASPQAVEALQFYLDLCDCGLIESQRRIEEYFRQGKVGFVVSGGWLLRRLKLNPPPFNYRLTPFFTPTGDTGTSFFGGEYLAVYARSPRAEAAKKLVEFLSRRENSQKLCAAAGFGFPPYDNLQYADTNEIIEARQLENSISSPPTPIWVDIEQDIEDAIEAAMYKHGSAREILNKASSAIDAKLESSANAKAN